MNLDFSTLDTLRTHHPAWRLLRSDHVALIASFLQRAFIAPNVRVLAAADLVEALEDELFALRERHGPGAYPKSASDYLNDWASPEKGWLRKFYRQGSDETQFDLTPATEKVIAWLSSLSERSFVGTESRLLTLFDLLKQMSQGSQTDPARRIAELQMRRDEIDAEMARIQGGDIQVLDDSALRDRFQQFQQIARELLEEHGVIVCVANNGREAINQLEGSRFDCVLMDVRMPEMDGLEATELIRANPDWREIPIIAMTANARTEDRRDCLAAGMNDFISKPVDPEQFFSILQKWLKPLSAHPSVAVNPAEKTEMPGTDAIASTDAEIDTRIIAGMVKNNPVKIVRFTQVFLDSTGPGMVNIQQALAVGDCEGLIQLGHRFKSSAKSMGALRFGALLAELETSAQAGDLEKAKSLVDEINASWQRVEAELKDFIALQENA